MCVIEDPSTSAQNQPCGFLSCGRASGGQGEANTALRMPHASEEARILQGLTGAYFLGTCDYSCENTGPGNNHCG